MFQVMILTVGVEAPALLSETQSLFRMFPLELAMEGDAVRAVIAAFSARFCFLKADSAFASSESSLPAILVR